MNKYKKDIMWWISPSSYRRIKRLNLFPFHQQCNLFGNRIYLPLACYFFFCFDFGFFSWHTLKWPYEDENTDKHSTGIFFLSTKNVYFDVYVQCLPLPRFVMKLMKRNGSETSIKSNMRWEGDVSDIVRDKKLKENKTKPRDTTSH